MAVVDVAGIGCRFCRRCFVVLLGEGDEVRCRRALGGGNCAGDEIIGCEMSAIDGGAAQAFNETGSGRRWQSRCHTSRASYNRESWSAMYSWVSLWPGSKNIMGNDNSWDSRILTDELK